MDAGFSDLKGCVSMRMYIVFEKGVRLRHIGHLDILRTMQRALRRSGLPVSYSKGFNPHILLGFASALSVGAVGENELMEVTLDRDVPLEELREKLADALPEDIRMKRVGILPEDGDSLMAMVSAAAWHGEFLEENREQYASALRTLLEKEEVFATRKSKSGEKTVDIRPLILSYEPQEYGFDLVLSQEEGKTCKPGMVMEALGKELNLEMPPRVLLTRTHLMTRVAGGLMVPLEDVL